MANIEYPADTCRRNGWQAGDCLEGDEGCGITIIKITAIGEKAILAKVVSHRGAPPMFSCENLWALDCREWKKVPNA